MALDTIFIKFLTEEINREISGLKIEKIHQPERDEILINIKGYQTSYRLVISANASHPRIHFTNSQKENPQKAPMFCMLLRKHLQGGKIICVKQIDFERIVRIDVESYDELGDRTTKYLYCEIMGRHSNIILTKSDNTVIDSIKHIDFSVSSVRQILPGLIYQMPPVQDKIPIISKNFSQNDFDFLNEGNTLEKVIMNTISGISPLLTREVVYNVVGSNNSHFSSFSAQVEKGIINELSKLTEHNINPCLIIDKNTKKSIDFAPFDIKQYETSVEKKYFENLNTLLDEFYKNRDISERMKQKSTDLTHLLNNLIERTSKKLAILKKTIDDAKRKDEYKRKGDLLTANIYRINQGDISITLENFYDESLSEISIPLDPKLSPSENVQRYYKLYQKAKTAQTEASKQLTSALDELEYLESTLVLLQNAQNDADLNAIRQELFEVGYMKKISKDKKQKLKNTSKPHHYISSDGFDIYVGKNNTQNDYLTLKFANLQDMWFHTKKIHGSHTIIKLGVNKEIPPLTIKEAASLAAYYSKARQSSNVPVDYTQIKNVKKPNGAKPGMVIYDFYNTIYATPSTGELEKLN